MTSAYVLLNAEMGLESQVLEEVKSVVGVQEAFVTYGVFDVVVKIKTDSMNELKELVTHRLRSTKGVRSTLTLILVEE
jgi:DNA-binding Lrp family transcriptional regulator